MDKLARKIVHDVVAYARRYPARSALEVVDMAMAGRHDSAPDFHDDNAPHGTELHPMTEFGEILCEAFALGLPPQTDGDQWQREVVTPFLRRYRLREREPVGV